MMQRSCHRWGPLAAVFILTAAICMPVARAQEPDPTPQEQAAKLYKEGIEAYYAADYAIAITKFNSGFELDPNAMFLYNLSLCFSKLGNFPEALANAEKAEAMGGMPDEARIKNRSRLASFSIVIKAGGIAENLKQDEGKPPLCAIDTDCEEGYICNVRRGICVESLVPKAEPSEPLFSPIGWVGVGVAGLGVVMEAVVLAINFGLPPDIREHERLVADGQTAAAEALRQSIVKRQRTGIILMVGGFAALAAGGGLIVYDLFFKETSPTETTTTTFVPWISPDGAGIGATVRF